MEIINSIIKSEAFLIGVAVVNLLLLILYVCNLLKLKKINKNYKAFMKKLGNGNNIEEMLRKYITKVEEVNGKSEEILNYCTRLDKDISLCIKKIGMVRCSAFKDTGSDLSFTISREHIGGRPVGNSYRDFYLYDIPTINNQKSAGRYEAPFLQEILYNFFEKIIKRYLDLKDFNKELEDTIKQFLMDD